MISEPINFLMVPKAGLKESLLSFLSLSGTFVYFVGCVLFIPDLHHVMTGTWLFIIGSVFFVLSSSVHIIRGCSTALTYAVESFIGLGAAFYCVGSIQYLPRFDISALAENLSATWFIVGSIFWVLAGGVMIYVETVPEGRFSELRAATLRHLKKHQHRDEREDDPSDKAGPPQEQEESALLSTYTYT
jgi:hypothetical protein